MAEVKWIKLSTDLFNNRKIKQIESLPDGDSIIVIWLKLLTLAGNVNDDGFIYFTKDIPYTDQLLATEFGRPVMTIQLALDTFIKFGMIEITNDLIKVSNWEKYQNIAKLEELREYNRLAQQKSRTRKKELVSKNVNDMSMTCQEIVNDMSMTCQPCQDTDIDIDIDREIDISNKRKKFTPPSLKAVKAYCEERKNKVDPERFIDYYTSNGWKVGKNPMKDWKACVRTWERNNKVNLSDIDERQNDYTVIAQNIADAVEDF